MNLNRPLIAVGVLVLSTLTILVINGQLLANFKKVNCVVYDKTFGTNYSCISKPINRYKTVLSVYIQLGKRIDNVSVHHQMYKKFNVIYRPFLVNVTEDFCKTFHTKTRSPYMNIILNVGQRYSNLNHSCPYEGWWIIKDMELDLSNLRVLLPDGEYRYDVQPYINNAKSPAMNFQVFIEIKSGWMKKN